MFSFLPQLRLLYGKTVQPGNETLPRYRMCDDGAATFQPLQIFNHMGRNANRIVFTAKCLFNGRVAFLN